MGRVHLGLAVGVVAVVAAVLIGWLVVGDGPDSQRGGIPPVSFGPADDDVFATGTADDARWQAAAGDKITADTALDGELPTRCVAIRWEPSEAGPTETSCSTTLADPEGPIELDTMARDPATGRVAVLGVADDTVDRLVWELDNATVEVELHDHAVVDTRVFAAVAHTGQDSQLVAYGPAGGRLAVETIEASTESMASGPVDGDETDERAQQVPSACAELIEARHSGDTEAIDTVLHAHGFTDAARIPRLLATHTDTGPMGCRGSAPPVTIDAVTVLLVGPAAQEVGMWVLLPGPPLDDQLEPRSRQMVTEAVRRLEGETHIVYHTHGVAVLRTQADAAPELIDDLDPDAATAPLPLTDNPS